MLESREGKCSKGRRVVGMVAAILFASSWGVVAQEYREPESNSQAQVSIDRYIGSWQDSEPTATHGSLIERAILKPGDPYKPGPPGAVLEFHKDFSLGTLTHGGRTQPSQHEEEEILYLETGSGRTGSSENFSPLQPGDGLLIPPHTEHVLVNESKDPITLLVLTDLLESGATPRKTILRLNSADLTCA